jgi:hypothetical protein
MSERATPDRGTERGIVLPDTAAVAERSGWRRFPQASRAGRADAAWNEGVLQRRTDTRTPAAVEVEVFSIDPSRDRETGELFFALSLDERTENLSRRGLCLRCERPPEIGARVLLQVRLPQEAPIDVVGLARWTSVAYEPGTHGGRAFARVGIELLGGAPRALERWDRALTQLERTSVASPGGHR